MHLSNSGRARPVALSLLSGERPRNVSWIQAASLLFGDWGTSRLYVLGLAFFFASRSSFYLIAAMSILIVAVGWAYTQICRIYPDGGGVYTAAKHRSRLLAVIGALLLFADYVVTASLSSLDAFRYFGLPSGTPLLAINSPGLWAIIAIVCIGAFNLMGPKHTGGFALFAALGMVFITILITAGALPQISWGELPTRIGAIHESGTTMWMEFVSIVLALSGVEAIANLTGVMEKPVARTARRAIWIVTFEVAIFNLLLAICMVSLHSLGTDEATRSLYRDDMLAFLSEQYIGHWAELSVRAVGGLLLLSATNTALTDMISVQYLMARDGELPQAMSKLNAYGVPRVPAMLATAVPVVVLMFSHDLEHLAALYAIGVIGAVALNVTLCAIHPRVRHFWRKGPMLLLGLVLLAIWVTLAATKLHALAFVSIVLTVGLSARALTRWWARRGGEKPSLLRTAILDQLTEEALKRPRVLVGTYGSTLIGPAALREAANLEATLVVCFIREVQLSHKYGETRLSLDTDHAAQRTFSRFLEMAHDMNVPILPVYDTGPDGAELMAEHAAVNGCSRVFIGTTRKGAIYHLIKGTFQRRLESLLPPDIPVQVVATTSVDED